MSACARASSENARWTTPGAECSDSGAPGPERAASESEVSAEAEVRRRERRAGQLRELARDELGGAAAVDGARDRVREPNERVAGPAHGALELPERRALQAVRVGARLHHRHHVAGIVRAGVGDDARLRQQLTDPPRRGHPVEDGHLHVHQHDVRAMRDGERDRLLAVLGLGHDFDPRLGCEARAKTLPCVGRVVADQQAKHRPTPRRWRPPEPDGVIGVLLQMLTRKKRADSSRFGPVFLRETRRSGPPGRRKFTP